MKNLKYAITLFLVIVNYLAYSQLSMGVKLGGGANFLVGNYVSPSLAGGGDNLYGFGWKAGMIFDIQINDKFSIRPEFLLTNRRVSQKMSNSDSKSELILNPTYIELPILVTYGATSKLNVLAGIQTSLLGGMKETYEFSSSSDPSLDFSYTAGRLDGFTFWRNVEFGYVVGSEYRATKKLLLGLRYMNGLQSFSTTFSKNYFHCVSFSITYMFRNRR